MRLEEMTAPLSAQELETIVRKAVRDEFAAAGLRVHDTDEQDAAREDFRFLRKIRQSFDGASRKVGGAIILSIVSGFVWLIWLGVQAILPPK